MRHRACLALLALAGCNQLLGLEPPPSSNGDAATARTPYWTFADDFELGDFRRWSQPGDSPTGTIDVDHTVAASGCCSMHVKLDAGAVGVEYKLIALPNPVTAGTLAMRARIKAVQLDHDTREMSAVEGGTAAMQFATTGLGQISGGGFAWGYDVSDPGTANAAKPSTATVDDAIGGWHCIEVVVNVAATGHIAIFSDDNPAVLVENDAALDTRADPGWDSVQFGLPFSSGTTTAEIYLDDAAVRLYHDDDRGIHIGCK